MGRLRKSLRKLLADHRRTRRRRAQRDVSLIVGITVGEGADTEVITGRTRDLSEKGLSMSLPASSNQRQLLMAGARARVLLVLPTKTVSIGAEVVHSQPLDELDPDKGQLTGVHIFQMSSEDEAHYREYLRLLK